MKLCDYSYEDSKEIFNVPICENQHHYYLCSFYLSIQSSLHPCHQLFPRATEWPTDTIMPKIELSNTIIPENCLIKVTLRLDTDWRHPTVY